MKTTKDLLNVKNQLQIAILKTFEVNGVDPYGAILILEGIQKDIQSMLINSYVTNTNENIQSDTE